jgi:NitT/TauT family transport system ATP-binding protein
MGAALATAFGTGVMGTETPQGPVAVTFDGVTKTFERPDRSGSFKAVDGLSFKVARGEIVAVLGKTGCGKSTVFNLIAGLAEPTAGRISVEGLDPFRQFAELRGKIGIVFQGDRLMPWRTAVANVLLGLEILGADQRKAQEVARGWLAKLGLAGHENDYPHALSGGMRQRVAIARAFAVDPALMLCDEPFSALDEMTAQRLRAEFLRLVRETGRTALFITHSIDEALEVGDRIMVLHRPARIAFEADVGTKPTPERRAELRTRILDVMASEAPPPGPGSADL